MLSRERKQILKKVLLIIGDPFKNIIYQRAKENQKQQQGNADQLPNQIQCQEEDLDSLDLPLALFLSQTKKIPLNSMAKHKQLVIYQCPQSSKNPNPTFSERNAKFLKRAKA